MIFTFVAILFIILEVTLIGIILYLAYKNNSLISKNTRWYIIPVALLAVLIISMGYIYGNKNQFSLEGFGACVEYAAGLFVYSIKVTNIKNLLNDSLAYKICYYALVSLAFFTSTTTILGVCKNTIVNFCRVTLRKIRGTDIVVGYGPKALEYVKNTRNSILWINKPIKMNKDFVLKELYYNGIPYVLTSLNKRAIKSFVWRKNKDYNFIFFKENEILEYNELANLFMESGSKKQKNIKVYFEGNKEEITFINDQIAQTKKDDQCLLFCFDLYEKLARAFNWEHTIAESLPNGFINADGTISEDKTINVVFLGYGKVNSALFKALVMNNQFATYKKDHYEVKLVNYYLYDIIEENFNDFTINRLEQDYYCKDNREEFARMEKLCNFSIKRGNVMTKSVQDEIKSYIDKENSFTMIFVGWADDLVNISYSQRLLHYYGNKNIKIFCNVDNTSNAQMVDANKIEIYGLKNKVFSHEWIINDQILEFAIRRNYGYQVASRNLENLRKWGNLSHIKKFSNIYSVLSLKFKLNLMGLDPTFESDSLISEEKFNSIYYASEKPRAFGYDQYFEHNIRCTIGFTEHLRWCAFYYLSGFDVMDHTLCYLADDEKKSIITKDEEEKYHADLLSYYGLDHLNQYFLKQYPDKKLKDIEVYQYDYLLCDLLMKDIEALKEALFNLGIRQLEK